MNGALGILWAGLASGAFAFVFNVRGRDLPVSACIGALGWAVYLSVAALGRAESIAYFSAAIVVVLFAELASRLLNRPATTWVVCAIIPLTPGGGMYYMMSESLAGDMDGAIAVGFATLGTAGAIAAGLAIGSAIARLARRL